jgi:hypothetical protein
MKILTCYGKTTANLPVALKWAQGHNDSIERLRLEILFKRFVNGPERNR